MTEQTPKLAALDHLVLTVADLEQTLRFYTTLGMKHVTFQPADGPARHALMFGQQKINLHVAGHEFEPKAQTALPGTADLCFLTETLLDTWITHLDANKIPILEGPVPRTGATGPITSIYLRDPDGNLIEIANPA